MGGYVPAKFEALCAALCTVHARKYHQVGEDFESFVTDGVRWCTVGDDAAVADAFAVDSDVDGGGREVARTDGAYHVFQDKVWDVFTTNL